MSAIQQALLMVSGAVTDPYFSSVSLLLHMDGVNGATTFTDNSSTPKTITPSGSAQVTTANFKFGTGSLKTLTSPNNSGLITAHTGLRLLNNQPWTIEFWIYFNDVSSSLYFFASRYFAGGSSVWFYTPSAGNLGVYVLGGGPSGVSPISTGSWYHVALSFTGIASPATGYDTSCKFFVNGQLISSGSAPFSQPQDTGWYIGGAEPSTVGNKPSPSVNIDEVRITQGVARYTANFTPPTAAFPNS